MVTLGRHVEFRKVTLAARAGTAAAIKLTANKALREARWVMPFMAGGSDVDGLQSSSSTSKLVL
jgi:hypothetical protein